MTRLGVANQGSHDRSMDISTRSKESFPRSWVSFALWKNSHVWSRTVEALLPVTLTTVFHLSCTPSFFDDLACSQEMVLGKE